MEMTQLLWLGLALFGVIGSALCSGLETASYCVNRLRLTVRAARKPPDRAARALKQEIDHPERLLSTLLISNNFFNYAGAMGITAILVAQGYSEPLVILINAALLTPLLFIFGETLPKEISRIEADRIAYFFARPLAWLRILLTIIPILPFVLFFARIVATIGAPKGGEKGKAGVAAMARARMAAMLKETAAQGVLSESQSTLVDRALAMRQTTVADEMVPWHGAGIVRADWNRPTLMAFLRNRHHTRFPVINNAGKVIGILDQLDVYLNPNKTITQCLREPARSRPDQSVQTALAELARMGIPRAIVERANKPIGLVTPKDLVEPLVGELAQW